MSQNNLNKPSIKRVFGLAGKNISYSFSTTYFAEKFKKEKITDAHYGLFDLAKPEELSNIFDTKNLVGFNITIPYKEDIIPLLDSLVGDAKEIKAVNTVLLVDGKKKGYNTDAHGFKVSFEPLLQEAHKKALIFGSGGASKAIKYVLTQLNIPYLVVSRKKKEQEGFISYEQITEELLKEYRILINCTPVGTHPNTEAAPALPYEFLSDKHLLYDLVYNPAETTFLRYGKEKGASIKNGLEMLEQQAEKAWEIWNQPTKGNEKKKTKETAVPKLKIELKKQDCKSLDKVSLYQEMKRINALTDVPPSLCKKYVNEIKHHFDLHIDQEIQAKRKPYIEKNGSDLDFDFRPELLADFSIYYKEFRSQLQTSQKKQQEKEKENLSIKQQLIHDLKQLYAETDFNSSEVFKDFKRIRTTWKETGKIPATDFSQVNQNYHFHLGNFFSFLDTNKDLQKIHFEHHLKLRENLIEIAKTLLDEKTHPKKAINQLLFLHSKWKEETVPVAEEDKERTWKIFKEISDQIRDRKKRFDQEQILQKGLNLEKKKSLLIEIQSLTHEKTDSRNHWNKRIKTFDQFCDTFKNSGPVLKKEDKDIWTQYKEIGKNFHQQKNLFYKEQKSRYQENLGQKKKLIDEAKKYADSSNWKQASQELKRLQQEWKKTGPVPKKVSDKVWNEFRETCNGFFDRMKTEKSNFKDQLFDNLKTKKALLDQLKKEEFKDSEEKNLEKLNNYNIKWSLAGELPKEKKQLNNTYSDLLSDLLEKHSLSSQILEENRLSALLTSIRESKDEEWLNRNLRETKNLLSELNKDLSNLENNMAFFKNAKADNPLLIDVQKKKIANEHLVEAYKMHLRSLSQLNFNP